MAAVWIVDDDESIRWVLERALTRHGFEVRAFSGAADCLDAFRHGVPDALVSDIRMPGENGIDLLKRIKTQYPKVPVIIMTAYSDLDSAVSALQGGAFEYLPKPFDVADAVDLIRRAVSETETALTPASGDAGAQEILGQAGAMQEVFRAIGRLSNSNVTVLITGESGTGKELVARALHEHSNRSQRPFVALNTAAIPRDLLESELFGHERGAFTGAQQSRVGRFEQAEGGTLFLDEIGDMPAELQTRLLRVLSDGQYYRVGGQQPQRANVRIIAATHQELEERVRQGLFREDLFHRLHVIRLRLPSLRERREDIPLLARHFLQKSARTLGGETKRLSDEALSVMVGFAWPGNVRQLENVCHWLTVMAPSLVIGAADLPPELKAPVQRLAAGPAAISDSTLLPGLGAGGMQSPAVAWSNSGAIVAPGVDAVSLIRVPDAGIRSASVESAGTDDAAAAAHSVAVLASANGASGIQAGVLPGHWSNLLQREVAQRLDAQLPEQRGNGHSELMDELTRIFESTIIRTALQHTRGRRIEAALRLGIGRNTITRKIQDLHIDE